MIPILDSKRQYAKIGSEVEKAVCEVLRSGQYILGPNCKALEAELAKYIGCNYTVALNSGTDALHLALRALDIGAGDEVITTAFTFVATTEAIGIVGATPVFADIDADTFNIDPKKIEEKITPKTKAIIPVHLYGMPAKMDEICAIAEKYDIPVFIDEKKDLTQNVLVKQCKIFGNTAYIVRAEKNQNGTGDYDLQTIEIISDINFRSKYGIKDNDDITLEVWTFLVLKIISLAYNSKSKEIKELYVGDI